MAGVTYEKADEKVIEMINRVADMYHQNLKGNEVKFLAIMAYAPLDEEGNRKRPAITKSGNACSAFIRVLPLKERLVKEADAEITIDGDVWEEYPEATRIAVIDHELSHLNVKLDKNGDLKRDALRRPMLKTIRDDIVYWGNSKIAERHGANSIEVLAAKQLKDRYGDVLQLFDDAKEAEEDKEG